MNISIVNALWVILVGESLNLEDPRLKNIIEVIDKFVRVNVRTNFILQAISPILTKMFDKRYNAMSEAIRQVSEMIKPYIEEHK